MDKIRRLTYLAALSCELALEAPCRCRCGGQLHGARRTESMRRLRFDDPHHPDGQGDLFREEKDAR